MKRAEAESPPLKWLHKGEVSTFVLGGMEPSRRFFRFTTIPVYC